MRTPADRRGQVEQILATLATHGLLVAEGLDGSVIPGDRPRNKAIDALAAIKALTPYEEGEYRLNPRLRDFISDHLQSYNAFQAFTRLSGNIRQARQEWREMHDLKADGEVAKAERMQWALDDTISEVVYVMDRNLNVLNSQLSTDYGNVESRRIKSRQNQFYDREINVCRAELNQLDELIKEIAEGAMAIGFHHVRSLINVRLMNRMLSWRSRLNDCQASISKQLGKALKVETKIKNLGRVALWLAQNKTSDGFQDIELDERAVALLLTPESLKVKWNLDASDTDPVVFECMTNAVAAMPPPRVQKNEVDEVAPAQEVLYTKQEEIEEEHDPVDLSIERAATVLTTTSAGALSLAGWYTKHGDDLGEISEEEWLLYASRQLGVLGFKVEFSLTERVRGVYNDLFSDVRVSLK